MKKLHPKYWNFWLGCLVILLVLQGAYIVAPASFAIHLISMMVGLMLAVCWIEYQEEKGKRSHINELKNALDKIPSSLHVMPASDESEVRMVAMTFQNGDVSTIAVPADYHPSSDNGALLLKEVFGDEPIPDVVLEAWKGIF